MCHSPRDLMVLRFKKIRAFYAEAVVISRESTLRVSNKHVSQVIFHLSLSCPSF